MCQTITFTVCFCGMSDEYFSDKIMIYKPHKSIEFEYCFGKEINCEASVTDLIKKAKCDVAKEDVWVEDLIQLSSTYIKGTAALFRLSCDKRLLDVFSDFQTTKLDFVQFCVGGASLHSSKGGYRFTVHSDEQIHKNMPHVHVCKSGHSVRYSLETLESLEKGKIPYEYIRDEKKIILPYLKKKQTDLLDMWDKAMKGYIPPTEDEDGNQFYNES